MTNTENGCAWHFGAEGPVDLGPTDPTKGAFKSTPEINVVREAIQNAIDARPKGSTQPARVVFQLSHMDRTAFPAFFELRGHIKGALQFYRNNTRAQEKFPQMIQVLSKKGSDDYADRLDILTIGDFNTTGMAYKPGDTGCAFYAFAQSIGVSASKGAGSGGSNGLGKNTLSAYSSIRTVLISSKTKDGAVVFQGRTDLATHFDPKDPTKKVSKFGKYGIDENEPITIEAEIPEQFRRSEVGTDIHVVGVDAHNPDKLKNDLVRAVLNHFWLSICDNLLRVNVLGCEITAENIGQRMGEYFSPVDFAEGQVSNLSKWTPVPYWRAVENAGRKVPNTKIEEETLETVGKVALYLDWSAGNYPKRVVYMRNPRMSIYKQTKTSYPSFAAVFVCLEEKGNDLLKDTEPPDHGSWEIGNYEGADKQPRHRAIKEVTDFVDRTLNKYLRPEAAKNQIIIPGLAELLPDTKERTGEGESGTIGSGASEGLQPSGELAHQETAAPTTYIEPESAKSIPPATHSREGTAIGLVEDLMPADDSGLTTEVFKMPEPVDSEPNPDFPPAPKPDGNPVEMKVAKGGAKPMNIRVKIAFRVGAHKRDGKLWHRIVVRPAQEDLTHFSSVSLALTTGSDNGVQDSTKILQVDGVSSDLFSVEKQQILGLDIREGCKLDVLFADQIMHSVKVVAHAHS